VAGLATFYTVILVFAAGLGSWSSPPALASCCCRSSSTPPARSLFVMTRREQNRRLFSPAELVILVIAVAGFDVGVTSLATGAITI
jgi:arginine:ornithine antiporter/lysine permease